MWGMGRDPSTGPGVAPTSSLLWAWPGLGAGSPHVACGAVGAPLCGNSPVWGVRRDAREHVCEGNVVSYLVASALCGSRRTHTLDDVTVEKVELSASPGMGRWCVWCQINAISLQPAWRLHSIPFCLCWGPESVVVSLSPRPGVPGVTSSRACTAHFTNGRQPVGSDPPSPPPLFFLHNKLATPRPGLGVQLALEE